MVRALNRGSLVVADAASQAVAACTLPETQPRSFLEIGAGRGTKTLLIQSAAYERYGSFLPNYVTIDLHKYKSDLLLKRTQEAAIPVQEALTGDATKLAQVIGDRKFDVVFIDAPCSEMCIRDSWSTLCYGTSITFGPGGTRVSRRYGQRYSRKIGRASCRERV